MSELKTLLGISTNLLNGLDHAWMSPANGNNALFKATDTLVEEPSALLSEERGKWDFPVITLHDTPQSLLTALLPYRIKNPDDALETAEISTGSLMIGDKGRMESLEALSATLGVDLKKTNSGYALVRLSRMDCEIFHSSIPGGYLSYILPTHTPKALSRAASSLKREDIHRSDFVPDAISPEDAAAYLGFFDEQGTHYVSGAVLGDEIFQIFQFAPEPYNIVKKTYAGKNQQKLSGVDAVPFIRFTTPYQNESTGYVEKYGRLLSLSPTERLTNPAELSKWKDKAYSKKESIFTPFRMGGGVSLADLNRDYTEQTAIEIHLTSLTLFMEYSRRLIWESVFNKAILQKYLTTGSRNDSCPGTFVPMLSQEVDVKEIKTTLDYIDVISQSNGNDEKQYRHVMAVADAFDLYDRWLQYTYLQPGTTIEEFTPEGILRARAEQDRKTNDSLTRLQQFQSCITDEIEVPVEIPVAELKDGGTHLFRIWNDFCDFLPYTDTRILSVVARVDGIESTDSGQYDLRIGYTGRPFFNKGLDGTFMTFHTQPRERIYSYKVEGNQPLFDDGGRSWSEGVTMVTPYSVWEISLPQASNAGLCFQSGPTVMVILTFKLQARTKGALQAAVAMPTEAEVVKSMSGNSKLRNWDVVFNMLLDKINDVLRRQYDELKKKNDNNGKIQVSTMTKTDTIKGYNIDQYAIRIFDFNYGYPLLKFLVNSADQTKLSFMVSGNIQSGTKWIGDVCERTESKLKQLAAAFEIPLSNLTKEVIDKEEKLVLSNPGEVQSIKDEEFTATIKLSTVTGIVNSNEDIMSVVLDMAQGTFDVDCFEKMLTGDERASLRQGIKDYFSKNSIRFIINSLDTSIVPTLDELKPNQFLFKVLKTRNGHEILQLYIRTNKRVVTDADRSDMYLDSVEEPIPSGSHSSLIINNRIMFNEVLPKTIDNTWRLVGADDGGKRCSEFTNVMVVAEVNLPTLNHTVNIPFGHINYEYEFVNSSKINTVNCELTGMRILSQDDGEAKLNYLEKIGIEVYERVTTYLQYKDPKSHVNEILAKVLLSITGNLPLALSGWRKAQTLEFDSRKINFKITGQNSGGGFCGSEDIHKLINDVLVKELPDQLRTGLKFTFSGFSVFALQNLLFPCNYSIKLKTAYLPADLVLFGDLY